MPSNILFHTFNRAEYATLVTANKDYAVVACRNHHGTHNMVLCIGDVSGRGWVAYRHGNDAVISALVTLKQRKLAYRAAGWLTRKW